MLRDGGGRKGFFVYLFFFFFFLGVWLRVVGDGGDIYIYIW